jgi:arginyl-tRNA synthetase
VITADVRRAVWAAARDATAAGELPAVPVPAAGQPSVGAQPEDASAQAEEPGAQPEEASAQLEDASTLRPVPAALGGGPGRYASTLPYLLAAPGTAPVQAAAILAARLARLDWVAAAEATAATGHLTVSVTGETLAALAVRIPQAPDCARSDILRGLRVPAAPVAGLAGAAGWPQAHARVAAEVTARLAEKAGAEIFTKRARPAPAPAPAAGSPVAAALADAGSDAVRYALVSRSHGWRDGERAEVPVRYHLDNPVYAVRYAHAHAACTLRQAADLGLGAGPAAQFVPCLLTHPAERALLDALSWLPERVAWAARIRRPAEFARYLEELAGAYQDCRESRPALPSGGCRAPRDRPATRARLWLVTAAGTAIAAGLGLLGISAPDRL